MSKKLLLRSTTIVPVLTKTRLVICISLMLLTSSIHAQMYLSGRNLYTANNEKVVLRGVNEMFIYGGDKSGYSIYPEIEKSGSNCVRITWNTGGSAADLKNTIYNCVTRGRCIAMVTLNDATGNFNNVQKCLDYWKRADVKQVMSDLKKWVILNIANEAGDGNVSDASFISKYQNAISQLRGAGYNVPLVVDATSYGQNWAQLRRCWTSIYNSDPQRKTIFSAHTYWTTGGNNLIYEITQYASDNNMPFIIGEGPQQNGYDCNTAIDYKYFMQRLQEKGIGWLAWSWGYVQNGDCQSGRKFDITSNGYYNNWISQWSKDVVYANQYSIKNTSARPGSIYNGNVFARTSGTQQVTAVPNELSPRINLKVMNLTNPVKSALSFTVRSTEEQTVDIKLFNASGMQVYTKQNVSVNKTIIVDAALAPGIYFMNVNSAKYQEMVKIVKQ